VSDHTLVHFPSASRRRLTSPALAALGALCGIAGAVVGAIEHGQAVDMRQASQLHLREVAELKSANAALESRIAAALADKARRDELDASAEARHQQVVGAFAKQAAACETLKRQLNLAER